MIFLTFLLIGASSGGHLTNEWALQLKDGEGGLEKAREIAREAGCEVNAVVFEDTTFSVECPRVVKRSTRPHKDTSRVFDAHPAVEYHEQQRVLKRVKRQLFNLPFMGPQSRASKSQMQYPPQEHYNDPLHLTDQRY